MFKTFWILVIMMLLGVNARAENNNLEAEFEGPWHGELIVGAQKLPIVFHITRDGDEYTATMDSPAQGAKGIAAKISISENIVDISIPIIRAQYVGELSGVEIHGTFSQTGMSFPLTLYPGEYIPPRPQTPQPPFPYETQEVSIVNPFDSAVLAGTLTFPVNYDAEQTQDKKFPVVVMVTGSGLQNRDEELFGHQPFAIIANHLALNGIASLRYDDRGFGDSTGDVDDATTATFASDAKAAVEWVRRNVPEAGEVGVLGHSEGGAIAFMLAADNVPDFIVTLASPAVSGEEILLMQNRALMGKSPATEAYIAALQRVLDFMRENPGETQWHEFGENISDLMLLPPHLKENLQQIIATRNPWLDYFISYDPAQAIAKTVIPVMAINGSSDKQVDAETNLGTIRRLLPTNTKNLIKEYPGLNHLMQHCTTGDPSEYMNIDETISPEVLDDITRWINAVAK